jgi:ABC-type transport system involved in multi-copper enzyme maturation permease subunit
MLREIIRKEILEHLMSLRFSIACVLCFVVVLCSLFVRFQDYRLVLDDYNQNILQARTQLKEMDEPWRLVFMGTAIHQAPNPLKIFVRGVETANGMSVRVTGHEPVQFFVDFLPNPLVPLFPAMDMICFAGIIMSLLAIVFGYDAICGEKQRGTLRMMLSYSLPRDTVLLGKWVGGLATLLVPFVLTIICGVAIVLVQTNVSLTGGQWLKLAEVCGLALLYVAAIYSMALAVSCMTPRPSTSIMVLVTIWLILVLAIPNLSPYLAQTFRPALSPMEVETARRMKTNEIWKREIDDKMAVYDKEHGFKTSRWWSEVNWEDPEDWKRGRQRSLYELECAAVGYSARMRECRKIDEDFERSLDAQIHLSRWISRLSPFSCFAMASTELTDTGLVGKRRFIDQVRDYQEGLADFAMKEWILMDRAEIEIRGTDKKLPEWPDKDRSVPRFAYTPPAGSEYYRIVFPDVGILAGLTVVFLMLSFLGFVRYDVR